MERTGREAGKLATESGSDWRADWTCHDCPGVIDLSCWNSQAEQNRSLHPPIRSRVSRAVLVSGRRNQIRKAPSDAQRTPSPTKINHSPLLQPIWRRKSQTSASRVAAMIQPVRAIQRRLRATQMCRPTTRAASANGFKVEEVSNGMKIRYKMKSRKVRKTNSLCRPIYVAL